MTQQYIVGEFSSLLATLRPAPGQVLDDSLYDLRRQVEFGGWGMLPGLAQEALDLADAMCWSSFEQADADAFARYVGAAIALREFGVSAGLLA